MPFIFKWLGYISPFKYTMEILMRAEFDRFAWGPLLREQWDYNLGVEVCYIVIVGYILLFRVGAFMLMSKNVRKFN